jgi:NUDIX domain
MQSKQPELRQAGRVLVIDPAGRVLLLEGFDPAQPDRRYWVTIGGGLDGGESTAQAAIQGAARRGRHRLLLRVNWQGRSGSAAQSSASTARGTGRKRTTTSCGSDTWRSALFCLVLPAVARRGPDIKASLMVEREGVR